MRFSTGSPKRKNNRRSGKRICEKMVNRGHAEAHNQVSNARRSLRTFGQVVRETPGPVMASLVLGLILLSYYFSQETLTGELSDFGNLAKYSGEEFDQFHLNYNQTKIVLITGDTRIGDVLGRLLATAKGVNYWDLPLKFCWEKPKACIRELGSLNSVRLL